MPLQFTDNPNLVWFATCCTLFSQSVDDFERLKKRALESHTKTATTTASMWFVVIVIVGSPPAHHSRCTMTSRRAGKMNVLALHLAETKIETRKAQHSTKKRKKSITILLIINSGKIFPIIPRTRHTDTRSMLALAICVQIRFYEDVKF